MRQQTTRGSDQEQFALPVPQLQQVPKVSVKICKYRHSSVGLLFRRPGKLHSASTVLVVIPPEIVGLQKEKDPATGLVANPAALLRPDRPRQQKPRPRRTRRRHQHPPLAVPKVRILHQNKTERLSIERDRLLVVTNHEGNVSDLLSLCIGL